MTPSQRPSPPAHPRSLAVLESPAGARIRATVFRRVRLADALSTMFSEAGKSNGEPAKIEASNRAASILVEFDQRAHLDGWAQALEFPAVTLDWEPYLGQLLACSVGYIDGWRVTLQYISTDPIGVDP